MARTPSKYQERIIAFGKEKKGGHGRVNAVAGSGKSTSLFMFLEHVQPRNAVMISFNKPIAEENGNKLVNLGFDPKRVKSKTVHSIGYGMLAQGIGRPHMEADKYWDLVREAVNGLNIDHVERREAESSLFKLAQLARLNHIDPGDVDALDRLMEHHVLEDGEWSKGLHYVLERGLEIAEKLRVIDYTDMLWVPYKLNLDTYSNEWVLVDEAQDISAAQRWIAKKCISEYGGRSLWVGDEFQAIYGFAGADSDSFQKIKEEFDAVDLFLSICYRCPKSHIELAREIVPHIEWRDNAPDGTIQNIPEAKLHEVLQPGDLVMCRFTAPLVKSCLNLIKRRVPAKVKGREIGEQIASVVDSIIKMPGYSWSEFPAFLQAYRREKLHKLEMKEASESKIQALLDKCECVDVCYMEFNCENAHKLKEAILSLFADEKSLIWLSTVHRAKGLEADRTFILQPDALPFTWPGQKGWQYQQEINLQYVAYTRARQDMFLVSGRDPVHG